MLKYEKYCRYFNKIIIYIYFKVIFASLLLFLIIDYTICNLLNEKIK